MSWWWLLYYKILLLSFYSLFASGFSQIWVSSVNNWCLSLNKILLKINYIYIFYFIFLIIQQTGKTFEVSKLQLPEINISSLKVIFEDQRTYASPTAVSYIRFYFYVGVYMSVCFFFFFSGGYGSLSLLPAPYCNCTNVFLELKICVVAFIDVLHFQNISGQC